MPWTFYNSSGEAMIQDGAMTIANNTNNRVVTATGADPASLNGEAALTFDGEHLTIGDGNLVIGTAGHGIDFSNQASPASGMTSELLDRYEEGTWTPTIADDNKNGTGESQAYSVQLGRYTRIGRVVYASFSVTISDLGTLTTSQNARVMGLPFTSTNTGQYSATFSVSQLSGASITATSSPVGALTSNETGMQLFQFDQTTGIAIITVAQLSAGGSIRASGFYIVD